MYIKIYMKKYQENYCKKILIIMYCMDRSCDVG